MTSFKQGNVLLVPFPCVVKPLLSSFDTRLVRRKLGTLSDSDRARARALFARILDLR
ncbi:MAG TPA: hypothetical protein VMY40_05500 [Anaerolineae bacterium]|nr:hypothetical protein [Anaerolineae bacterium]